MKRSAMGLSVVVLGAVAAAAGCFDFDAAHDRCLDAGDCGDDVADSGTVTPGGDAGPGQDSGNPEDAGVNPGMDAGVTDAGFDAGFTCPPGQLCDGGYFTFVRSINALWANAPDDLWAGGTRFNRYHWNGTEWATIKIEDTLGEFYAGAWGSGPNDVWLTGTSGIIDHWTGNSVDFELVGVPAPATGVGIYGVAGSGPNDVWFVGGEATILHWDGGELGIRQYMAGSGSALVAVWVSDAGTGWTVGETGLAFTLDAGTWVRSDIPDGGDFESVFGFGPTDVFAAGANGIFRFDGGSWTKQPNVAIGSTFNSVHGVSQSGVFVGGSNGKLVYFDGATWKSLATNLGTTKVIQAVHVTHPGEVWVAGYDQTANGGFIQRFIRTP